MIDGIRERDLKELYHLTDIKNLDSILANNLLPRNMIKTFSDVAYADIIDFRSKMGLNDYIPFHFFPQNPFDGIVQRNYPNIDFIYICITRALARHNNFIIFPKHPRSLFPLWNYKYCYDDGIKAINWDILEKRDYKDNDNRHICMAECLTDLTIPANYFSCIVVKNPNSYLTVKKLLKKYNLNTPIKIKQNWFA